MAKTQEETIAILNEAIELLKQSEELGKKINDTFKKLGVVVCATGTALGTCYNGKASQTLHVYSGIKKLAKALGAEPYHPKFYEFSEEDKSELAFVYGDYQLFEMGTKIQKGYSFK